MCTSAHRSYLQQVRLSVLELCNCRKSHLSGVDSPSAVVVVRFLTDVWTLFHGIGFSKKSWLLRCMYLVITVLK